MNIFTSFYIHVAEINPNVKYVLQFVAYEVHSV